MEVGGLVAYAFQAIFGNIDIMTLVLTSSIFITLFLVAHRIYDDLS